MFRENKNFEQLHQNHVKLLLKKDNPQLEDTLIDEAKSLLEDIRSAGCKIVDVSQRQRLESYAEYWALFIYEATNEYPNTSLLELNSSYRQPTWLEICTECWYVNEFNEEQWNELTRIIQNPVLKEKQQLPYCQNPNRPRHILKLPLRLN